MIAKTRVLKYRMNCVVTTLVESLASAARVHFCSFALSLKLARNMQRSSTEVWAPLNRGTSMHCRDYSAKN